MANSIFQYTSGQNLRYTGKAFPGFIKGLPYMVFVAPHSAYQILVSYNGHQLVVEKYFTEKIEH